MYYPKNEVSLVESNPEQQVQAHEIYHLSRDWLTHMANNQKVTCSKPATGRPAGPSQIWINFNFVKLNGDIC